MGRDVLDSHRAFAAAGAGHHLLHRHILGIGRHCLLRLPLPTATRSGPGATADRDHASEGDLTAAGAPASFFAQASLPQPSSAAGAIPAPNTIAVDFEAF